MEISNKRKKNIRALEGGDTNNNNNEIDKKGLDFYLNLYNLSIENNTELYNDLYNELKNNFINISKWWGPYDIDKKGFSADLPFFFIYQYPIEAYFFFFKLIKNEFVGKMAYIPNSYFTSKISNFDNYSNYNVNRELYFFQNGKDIWKGCLM